LDEKHLNTGLSLVRRQLHSEISICCMSSIWSNMYNKH